MHSHTTIKEAESCYPCKLASLNINSGGHKVHAVNGDPWEGNPVLDRINELQAEGRRVEAMELRSNT
jgi:hypothetical protein